MTMEVHSRFMQRIDIMFPLRSKLVTSSLVLFPFFLSSESLHPRTTYFFYPCTSPPAVVLQPSPPLRPPLLLLLPRLLRPLPPRLHHPSSFPPRPGAAPLIPCLALLPRCVCNCQRFAVRGYVRGCSHGARSGHRGGGGGGGRGGGQGGTRRERSNW